MKIVVAKGSSGSEATNENEAIHFFTRFAGLSENWQYVPACLCAADSQLFSHCSCSDTKTTRF